MKIEQLLVQHFYNTRELKLQGMGIFTLSPDFVLPAEQDKDVVMPENAISFAYDPKTTEDESLITYIVQQTKKIRPLASADLDSFLILGKQFLNIGKPFKIDGLGKLEKNQQGSYDFLQDHFSNNKREAAPVTLKEKQDTDISFAAEPRPSSGSKKGLLIAGAVIIILMIGAAAWYLLNRKKHTPETAQEPVEQATDTTQKITTKSADSIALSKPAVTHTSNDGYTFKIVFKETTDKAAAIAKMDNLIKRKHTVIMYSSDSVNYKLAEPFTLPLSDTTRIKDSLNKYYYLGKAYVEL